MRVRLQKINEKSVALKWNHNAQNRLVTLTGYRIYINEENCAELKAEDQIASINGLQDEGEYRIWVRACCGAIESANSNVVVTRVKRKQRPRQAESDRLMTGSKSSDFSHDMDREEEAVAHNESVEKKLEQIRSSLSSAVNFNHSQSDLQGKTVERKPSPILVNQSKAESEENSSNIGLGKKKQIFWQYYLRGYI